MAENRLIKILFKSLFDPMAAFEELRRAEPDPVEIFCKYSLWLLLMPPVFAWIGSYTVGWQVGADEPLHMSMFAMNFVSIGYFLLLIFGFISTSLISQWMAATYNADTNLGRHFALITIIGEPLAVASIAHLFPNIFFNVLVLIPTMIWSMYLLYKGVPVVLQTSSDRGMLMASSLVGWLLVAAVSLLGISMGLWTAGYGPLLGV